MYRAHKSKNDGGKEDAEPVLQKRNLFNKNGLPRHPERSIYYDPVMNPFGVAPPGMPYLERRKNSTIFLPLLIDKFVALRPDEVDSDVEMEDGTLCPISCASDY